MVTCGIFIFRRDLRVQDNIGFNKCLSECDEIYPVFIFTPDQISSSNPYRSIRAIVYMMKILIKLQKDLDNKLKFYYGTNDEVIRYVIDAISPNRYRIYCNEDWTPYAIKRDSTYVLSNDYYLFDYGSVLNKNKDVYKKFTPFYNHVIRLPISKPIPHVNNSKIWPKLKSIRQRSEYDVHDTTELAIRHGIRLTTDIELLTTSVSCKLKFGELSIRQIWYMSNTDRRRQLLWREFYAHVIRKYPDIFTIKTKWKNISTESIINSWKSGNTKVPIVDAYMRCLNTTGYIDNRGRLIVGNYLIKTLKVDWRIGEQYFAIQLVDYDPIINNCNWQWIAGTGPSAQPVYRTTNPWRQNRLHDPRCTFVRKWIPELRNTDVTIILKDGFTY